MDLRNRLLAGTTMLRSPDDPAAAVQGDLKLDPAGDPAGGGDNNVAAKPWYDGVAPEHAKLAADSGWDSPAKAFEHIAGLTKKLGEKDPFAGITDPDLVGYLASKGLRKHANPIAELLKSAVNMERVVGMDKLALPPKGADGKRDWSKWNGWAALGRPEAPDKYDIANLDVPDGTPEFDPEAVKAYLPFAHALGLSTDQVRANLQFLAKHQHGVRQAQAQALEERVGETTEALRGKWGMAYDKNVAVMNQAIRAFGGGALLETLAGAGLVQKVTDPATQKTAYAVAHPLLAEVFQQIGAKLQGDGNLEKGAAPADGVMTPAKAQAEKTAFLAELGKRDFKDNPFLNHMHAEHPATVEKIQRLNRLIMGDQAA